MEYKLSSASSSRFDERPYSQREAGRHRPKPALLRGLGSRCRSRGAFDLPIVFFRELLNPAGAVNKLHLPREKRVTVRTNIDMQLGRRAACLELCTATADDLDLLVLGMNPLLHGNACDSNKGSENRLNTLGCESRKRSLSMDRISDKLDECRPQKQCLD